MTEALSILLVVVIGILLAILSILVLRLIAGEHFFEKSMLFLGAVLAPRPGGYMIRVHTGAFCNLELSEALLAAEAAHEYGCVHGYTGKWVNGELAPNSLVTDRKL